MLYFTLASKAYARNLQYRGAHMVHNIASAMFGFMYACIWIGLGADYALGDYGTQGMVGYIAFTQAALWVSSFVTNGLGIPQAVRTGHISLDLMRPVHLFSHLMAKEWGKSPTNSFTNQSRSTWCIILLSRCIYPEKHLPSSM